MYQKSIHAEIKTINLSTKKDLVIQSFVRDTVNGIPTFRLA